MTGCPRIGVLLCTWAGGKDGGLDLEALLERARELPEVAFASPIARICSPSGQKGAAEQLRLHGVDRFVIAACSPQTKEPLWRELASSAGLHPLAFGVANIREQCAYVHDPGSAGPKAATLVEMAVAGMSRWVPPPYEDEAPLVRRAAVIGDGMEAAIAAHELAMQGIEVDLVMRSEGFEWPPEHLFESRDSQCRTEEAMLSLAINPRVNMIQGAELIGFVGCPGSFGLQLERMGERSEAKCGAVILAPHSEADFKVWREGGLHPLRGSDLSEGKRIVILPAGAGDSVGCACASAKAMRFAQTIVERRKGNPVTVLGREMRALGRLEALYKEAQRQGVAFVRIEQAPGIEGDAPFKIHAVETTMGELSLEADTVLVEVSASPQLEHLAKVFGVPMDEKGDFLTLEARLNGPETLQKGVFACRTRLGNMMADDLLLDARAAAAMAAGLLSKGTMEVGGRVAEVEAEKCSACLTCVRSCPYGAPRIGDAGKAVVALERCQGCGVCAGLCPSKAILMHGSSDAQLQAMTGAALRGAT